MMLDSPPPQLTLSLADDAAPTLNVRESPRARRLSVRVFRTGRVEVIKPRRASRAAVALFIEQHRAWIERKRSEALRDAVPPQPFPPSRIELSFCGESWRVHLAGGNGKPTVSADVPGVLSIHGRASDSGQTRDALRRWLLKRAVQMLPPALEAISRELGLECSRTVIRRQRSRWGSCSVRGTISLNCCLLFQRPATVRYLMVHELAHTLHMNHSKRFWHAVAAHCPDYRTLDAELLDGWRRVPAWVFDRPT
jgi:predicted metal-dependent hydrolase